MQYSLWAILENHRLNFSHLGIDFRDIESYPENVQSKLLQLIMEKCEDREAVHQTIMDGPYYKSSEAREGLAKGLLRKYYEGLEGLTTSWFQQEQTPEVRELLSEHFGRFGSESKIYEDEAISIIQTEPRYKDRLLMGAEGSSLWGKLQEANKSNDMNDMFADHNAHFYSKIKEQDIISKKKDHVVIKKTLILASNPNGTSNLRLDREVRDLNEKLAIVKNVKNQVLIDSHWATKISQIQDALFNSRPNILHFSGHGDRGEICFEDEAGNVATVKAQTLADLISLTKGQIECLVLNSCYSEDIANIAAKYVACVIGCAESIDDRAAIAFSTGFYRAIANGESYENAFGYGRNQVSLDVNDHEASKYRFVVQNNDQ